MTTYVDADGREIVAASAEDLVHQLHEHSQAQAESDLMWMAQAAERAEMITGQTIRCEEGAEAFVADLLRAGLLRTKGGDK